ncbi:hypothetical protein QAD02_012700 [Eretmocerus hayati]|uniref:Uncharacterized protein n=1 Tax=Eretmocerus hayati TaxID=131215 RepID=A0ACC2P0D4_9HYME|nr:hypothetical protein QAD02_012700 [Eretmocerus hayati]
MRPDSRRYLGSGTKPAEPAPKEPAPPPASNGQKGKRKGWRGDEQNANEVTESESGEGAAVTPNSSKPASTAAPKPPTPAAPTPMPNMTPWGFPWAFLPYPYWQTPGMPGM